METCQAFVLLFPGLALGFVLTSGAPNRYDFEVDENRYHHPDPHYITNPITGEDLVFYSPRAATILQAALDAVVVPTDMELTDSAPLMLQLEQAVGPTAHVQPCGGEEKVSTAFLIRRVRAMIRFFSGVSTLTLELALRRTGQTGNAQVPSNLQGIGPWLKHARLMSSTSGGAEANTLRLPLSQLVYWDRMQRYVMFPKLPAKAINTLAELLREEGHLSLELEQMRQAMNAGIGIIKEAMQREEEDSESQP